MNVNLQLILTTIILFSAALHIHAEYRGPRRHVYIFKPLTVLLIIALATSFPQPVATLYRNLVIAGLVFSLAGDVFLMLSSDRFMAGLASFLAAHLIFIAAFLCTAKQEISAVYLLPFLIGGGALFLLLQSHLGNLKAPVAVYICVISCMAWAALNRWLATEQPAAVLAFSGALFFLLSDSLLAWDRFKTKFHKARFYVLTTYFMAQWLIAFSITAG